MASLESALQLNASKRQEVDEKLRKLKPGKESVAEADKKEYGALLADRERLLQEYVGLDQELEQLKPKVRKQAVQPAAQPADTPFHIKITDQKHLGKWISKFDEALRPSIREYINLCEKRDDLKKKKLGIAATNQAIREVEATLAEMMSQLEVGQVVKMQKLLGKLENDIKPFRLMLSPTELAKLAGTQESQPTTYAELQPVYSLYWHLEPLYSKYSGASSWDFAPPLWQEIYRINKLLDRYMHFYGLRDTAQKQSGDQKVNAENIARYNRQIALFPADLEDAIREIYDLSFPTEEFIEWLLEEYEKYVSFLEKPTGTPPEGGESNLKKLKRLEHYLIGEQLKRFKEIRQRETLLRYVEIVPELETQARRKLSLTAVELLEIINMLEQLPDEIRPEIPDDIRPTIVESEVVEEPVPAVDSEVVEEPIPKPKLPKEIKSLLSQFENYLFMLQLHKDTARPFDPGDLENATKAKEAIEKAQKDLSDTPLEAVLSKEYSDILSDSKYAELLKEIKFVL